MANMANLTDEVAAVSTVVDSAITLINGISAQLQEALATGATPESIQTIIDNLEAKKTELANAVAANTPAEEPPQV